jgi:hypothetical protein
MAESEKKIFTRNLFSATRAGPNGHRELAVANPSAMPRRSIFPVDKKNAPFATGKERPKTGWEAFLA